MANQPAFDPSARRSLPAKQVWPLAAACLLAGLGAGYVFPVQSSPAPAQQASAPAALPVPSISAAGNAHLPSEEEMKQMADQQAAPLLAKLKSDPNNTALLTQLGAVYHIDHQFHEAAGYYGRAADIDPSNGVIRTKFALSLFRSGDAEGAIAQLNQVLAADPKNSDALFDLGVIRLQGKADGKGAVAAWQQLLKSNPQLSADRRAAVLRLMSQVVTMLGEQAAQEGKRNHDRHQSSTE